MISHKAGKQIFSSKGTETENASFPTAKEMLSSLVDQCVGVAVGIGAGIFANYLGGAAHHSPETYNAAVTVTSGVGTLALSKFSAANTFYHIPDFINIYNLKDSTTTSLGFAIGFYATRMFS